jgi:hypothetical protein
MARPGVSPNLGAQSIRGSEAIRKSIPGSTRGSPRTLLTGLRHQFVTGAESFCTIRFYLATLRKQGRNVFHALTLAFQGKAADPLPSG